MKVLLSSTFLKNYEKFAPVHKKRIEELIKLIQALADENYQKLRDFMIKQNAKKLKGTIGNHIFKLRIDKGNRLPLSPFAF